MPILPLTHVEPFAATLGVMLYPATDEVDPPKARAFAAQWLSEPIRRFHEAGHELTYDQLARIVMDAGEVLSDLDQRWWAGTMTGDLFKTFFVLAKSNPTFASWNNAIKIVESAAARAKMSGARTALSEAKRRFLTVAHLWGAWSIREGKFKQHPEVGYDGYADFQSFLTEAEILRDWGQNWRARRAKSKPPLPGDIWRVPEDWQPPPRQSGWPRTGGIPDIVLPEHLLAELKPAGRPRRRR